LTTILCVVFLLQLPQIFLQRFLFEDKSSLAERALYLDISATMLFHQPFGVGLGSFTTRMQNYTSQKLLPWLYQPVHNIFLLVFNETGLLGGLIFLSMFLFLFYRLFVFFKSEKSGQRKKQLAILISLLTVIFVIGFFDHYFFSLYAGQAMMFFVWGVVGSFLHEELRIKN